MLDAPHDRYELRRPLGGDVFTEVYEAWDREAERSVAVKWLTPRGNGLERIRTRFLRGASLMARIRHPRIVELFEVHTSPVAAVSMRLLSGGNLYRLVKQGGGQPLTRVAATMAAAVEGLAAVHAADVVHRNFTPSNVLLDELGNPHLTDFGVARLGPTSRGRLTRSGEALGEFSYTAPEQRVDPTTAGPAADIYSVGATTYFLATGKRPPDLYMAGYNDAMLAALPGPLQPIVRRATAMEPEARWASASELADALGALA